MGVNSRFVIGSMLALILAASSVAGPRIAAPARGGPFPSEPILILEPFGRGGGPDLLARALADELTNILHQPVTVENVTGGGATAAPRKAAQLPPDGYTLVVLTSIALLQEKPNPSDDDIRWTMIPCVISFLSAHSPRSPMSS